MKTLGIIVGVIGLLVVSLFGYVIYKQNQVAKQEVKKSSELSQVALGTMTSAEDKLKEAKELLSKKQTSLQDQAKAKQLLEEAITDAKKATQEQSDNPGTWYYLSQIYEQLRDINPKNSEYAVDALDHAIMLSPKSPELYNARATQFIAQERYKDAEVDLQEALKLDPKKANYYYKMGIVYKETERKSLAKEYFEKAKTLTSPENQMALAQIEVQIKNLEKKDAKPTGTK